MTDAFKQAIEEVKLRSPIEEVVRERVPELRRAGALWVACCPFHDEKTPSFKVDPQRATWRCYGACANGGDVLSFVQAAYRVEFMEALEILAARCGVELPRRGGDSAQEKGERDRLYGLLERAETFFRKALRGEGGAAALAYLRERGLEDATLDAFGVGFAPRGGQALLERARRAGTAPEALLEAGLARRDGEGRTWDFFQGRITFPVRDHRGRTVGFGARRLDDSDTRAPKYVNTSETRLFHKGRLIYGLDLALEHARKAGHLVLVEGYTDVMAAHQVGLRTVVAVLGTATTDEHAALVRRAGARRVTLVFDGDEAGRRATLRALSGLLPLECRLDVVRLEGGEDPCDAFLARGADAFRERLEGAVEWLEFLLDDLEGLDMATRMDRLDGTLELVTRLRKPLHRQSRLERIAERLDVPLAGVREQFDSLPQRRRERMQSRREEPAPPAETEKASPLVHRIWTDLVGACLLDGSLAARLDDGDLQCCPDAASRRLIGVVRSLVDGGGESSADAVMTALADDPVRDMVVPIVDAASRADGPEALFEAALRRLHREEEDRRLREEGSEVLASGSESRKLRELHQRLRERVI